VSHSSPTGLAHHFDDLEQQHEASTLGMWAFLVTEILFFGGLFLAYIIMRWKYPAAFAAASEELNPVLGGLNTGVLLISSLTMALAVRAAQEGKSKLTTYLLIATMILGATFLGVKGVEYYDKWEHHHIPGANFHFQSERPEFASVDPFKAESFFFLYFAMTGIHAAHMIIGLVLVGIIARKAWRGRYTADYYNPVEVTGLYWHFVDLVWIFLYPLLYLIHPK
jgi:cytochrome c oxidase subunit 3